MHDDRLVVIQDLVKVFKGSWGAPPVKALRSISFDIRRGEVFGLLGPNGSGKTTTIKILLGLLFPTSGSCRLFGLPPEVVESKSKVGFLPEESYLYRFLNAWETLDFYGALSGMPKARRKERAAELIERVGLTAAANRPLKGYSKGMARRIGIAAALIAEPELVILDEPTSGLDPIGNREIKDLILELKASGTTVLLCSHLLADVEDVCDRIAILAKGKVAALGTVADLLSRGDRFEFVTEDMTEEEAEQVKDLLAKLGKSVYRANLPRRRLEDLFLEVVAEHAKDDANSSDSTDNIS